jgi:uncharacterized protein YraI
VTVLPNTLGFVRLREGPSADTSEIGQIPAGTTVAFYEKRYDWYRVTYQGTSGWISGTYVEE